MLRSARTLTLVLVLLCVACDRPAARHGEADREFAASTLKGLLAYPGSSLVTIETGQDAAQATFSAPAPVERVATWYREVLRVNGWDLQNDGVMKDGGISIYAEKGKRPLWITLKSDGPSGTTYTLIGAELPRDSAAAPVDTSAQRSGSNMSSNRIQRR